MSNFISQCNRVYSCLFRGDRFSSTENTTNRKRHICDANVFAYIHIKLLQYYIYNIIEFGCHVEFMQTVCRKHRLKTSPKENARVYLRNQTEINFETSCCIKMKGPFRKTN